MLNLPIFYCEIIDSDEGLKAISFVEHPANESDFICFSEQEELKFEIQDEEQRIVSGVIMQPDKPIYRRDPDGREYYVVFSKDTIFKMAEKFFRDSMQNNITADHNRVVDGINLVEMFIKDSSKGIIPNYVDCPDGTLMGTYKVNNEEIWQSIKKGSFKGFSLEGLFTLERQSDEYEELKEIQKMLRKIKRVKH